MASATKLKFDPVQSFTITIASLTAGSANQADMLTNADDRPGALIYAKITSGGTGPAVTDLYRVYLLRRDDETSPTFADDNAGAAAAAITIENAPLLGTIALTNTANKAFYRTFDTGLLGPLGRSWTVAFVNGSGQTLNATAGNHFIKYRYYYPEAQ